MVLLIVHLYQSGKHLRMILTPATYTYIVERRFAGVYIKENFYA